MNVVLDNGLAQISLSFGGMLLPPDTGPILEALTEAQATLAAAPAAVADAISNGASELQLAAASLPTLRQTAAHQVIGDDRGRMIVLLAGSSVAVDFPTVGDGFACIVVNRSGMSQLPYMTGFGVNVPTNPSGFVRIVDGGVATLLCVLGPDGVTGELHLLGETSI